MTEIRKSLIWPLLQTVFFNQKPCEINSIIDLVFVKNLLRALGLSLKSYTPTSCTANFNKKYEKDLLELIAVIDDETKLVHFQTIINKLPEDFWLFVFTIPMNEVQDDFILYFRHKRFLSTRMVVYLRRCFRDVFVNCTISKDRQYQELSDNSRLIFADLSHTVQLFEFSEKLKNRVLEDPEAILYFWTKVFTVDYGKYI